MLGTSLAGEGCGDWMLDDSMPRAGPEFFYCGFAAGAPGAVAGGAGAGEVAGAGAAVGGVAGWAGTIRTVGAAPGFGGDPEGNPEAAGGAGLGVGSASLWAT